MRVGVGYRDNPDTTAAGVQAASEALRRGERSGPCDMVLLFYTSRHDAQALRDAVASVVGPVPIVGGGAGGAMDNEKFGYAGDQVAVACVWLDETRCAILPEGGLLESERETGKRLGLQLKERGTTPESPVIVFYDAFDRTGGGMRAIMSTWLLAGVEESLGFLPNMMGAGLMSDFVCSSTPQFIGDKLGEHYTVSLAFSGDIRIDSVIMHGCCPATHYYTVTKADGQLILEINGRPALEFIDELLESAIPPEKYPFLLMFGVNRGERWGEFHEDNYASRMCLTVDKERNAIVMFEPDMVEGTEFQLMYRTLETDYMKPRIETLFQQLGDREPVLALFLNCAGRAAGYGGVDWEDAVTVQDAVAGRAPLLGLYTGVEIAPVNRHSRSLDWTGVFCLFSTSKTPKGAGEI